MSTLTELHERTHDSILRNRIEMSLLVAATDEIDSDGTGKAYALTLLNESTAATAAQCVLRYLVAKYDIADPTDAQVNTAVTSVFAKLAGG